MIGFLNINKMDNMTSQQVVSNIKKKLSIKRAGHMGTLDPAGTGVLIVAVGMATKLFDLMLNKKKVYRAIFTFGTETDTLDAEGKVVKHSEIIPNTQQIQKVLPKMIGKYDQIPPMYSAKNVGGQRAYDLARKGEDFVLKPKNVEIFRFDLVKQIDARSFLFEIVCSSGTYVRSLCRDIATLLGTVAYMPVIIRTRSGEFDISTSVSFAEFMESDNALQYVQSIENGIKMDSIDFDFDYYHKLISGQSIEREVTNGRYWLKYNDNIFATGIAESNRIKMEVYVGD